MKKRHYDRKHSKVVRFTETRIALLRANLCRSEPQSSALIAVKPRDCVRAGAPVLALCRKLVSAGHDPRQPLHADRGNILALRVRSIGEGAQLAIAGDGVGFRRRKEPAAASDMHSAKPEPQSSRDQKPLNSGEVQRNQKLLPNLQYRAASPTCPGGTDGKVKSE